MARVAMLIMSLVLCRPVLIGIAGRVLVELHTYMVGEVSRDMSDERTGHIGDIFEEGLVMSWWMVE